MSQSGSVAERPDDDDGDAADGVDSADAPDEVLVVRAHAGDKAAFATLVLRHRDQARRLAERVLNDHDLARDASQEAVVVALLSLGRLENPRSFGPWLCGIALNVARRWSREFDRLGELPETDVADRGPGPAELAENSVLAHRVRRAIGDLGPGQRDAVLLYYLQGLSHREVAAELGISPGAVKARLHQARGTLAPRLSPFVQEDSMSPTPPSETSAQPRWVDVSVAGIRRPGGEGAGTKIHIVILRENGGTRELPIGVLANAAVALTMIVESVQMPRPMTHQFTANLLGAAGARVTEVRIHELAGGTFYASVLLDGPARQGEVDARPSDALCLACITGAPIRVDERVFGESEATGSSYEWRDYPTTESDLAEEIRRASGAR
jgi:RNA polymerase sigma factor (sigma-70 family)